MKTYNFPNVCLLQTGIADLFAQVSHCGKITITDRYGLMAAVLQDSLSEDEQYSIDRLLRAVRRGRLRVVDEL